MTLACEDTNSKIVDVIIVGDEDRVGNSLLQIWELRIEQKFSFMNRLWAQGLVKILKLKFRQDLKLEFCQYFADDVVRGYEVESWSRFWSYVLNCLILSLVEMLMFGWDFEDETWSRFVFELVIACYFGKLNLTLGSVVPLAMFTFCFEVFPLLLPWVSGLWL